MSASGQQQLAEISITLRDGQRLPVSVSLSGAPPSAASGREGSGRSARARRHLPPNTFSALRACSLAWAAPRRALPPISADRRAPQHPRTAAARAAQTERRMHLASAVQFLLRTASTQTPEDSSAPPGLPAGLSAHIMAVARGAAAASAASGDGPGGTYPRTFPAGLSSRLESLNAAREAARERLASSGSSDALPTDPALERIQRLSTAVAGSIFSDLISGALRPGDAGPPPASEDAIQKLKRNVAVPAGQQCSVCLCELAACSEGATQMPCGHCYHDACITKWLRSHNTCPVCRAQVEADRTPRGPSSLAALLQGWRNRYEAATEGASQAAGAAAANASSAPLQLPSSQSGDGGSSGSSGGGSRAPEGGLSEAELLSLSVGELRRRLTALEVDIAGVVEKRELQDLLRRHARPSPRLHVQVHMEVVPLPEGVNRQAALEAAARQATARAMTMSMSARAPAAATADARADGPTAASSSAPAPAETPVTRSRRRRREHVPGELKEPSTRPRRA